MSCEGQDLSGLMLLQSSLAEETSSLSKLSSIAASRLCSSNWWRVMFSADSIFTGTGALWALEIQGVHCESDRNFRAILWQHLKVCRSGNERLPFLTPWEGAHQATDGSWKVRLRHPKGTYHSRRYASVWFTVIDTGLPRKHNLGWHLLGRVIVRYWSGSPSAFLMFNSSDVNANR